MEPKLDFLFALAKETNTRVPAEALTHATSGNLFKLMEIVAEAIIAGEAVEQFYAWGIPSSLKVLESRVVKSTSSGNLLLFGRVQYRAEPVREFTLGATVKNYYTHVPFEELEETSNV